MKQEDLKPTCVKKKVREGVVASWEGGSSGSGAETAREVSQQGDGFTHPESSGESSVPALVPIFLEWCHDGLFRLSPLLLCLLAKVRLNIDPLCPPSKPRTKPFFFVFTGLRIVLC